MHVGGTSPSPPLLSSTYTAIAPQTYPPKQTPGNGGKHDVLGPPPRSRSEDGNIDVHVDDIDVHVAVDVAVDVVVDHLQEKYQKQRSTTAGWIMNDNGHTPTDPGDTYSSAETDRSAYREEKKRSGMQNWPRRRWNVSFASTYPSQHCRHPSSAHDAAVDEECSPPSLSTMTGGLSCCDFRKKSFESRNALFRHLRTTADCFDKAMAASNSNKNSNNAIPLPNAVGASELETKESGIIDLRIRFALRGVCSFWEPFVASRAPCGDKYLKTNSHRKEIMVLAWIWRHPEVPVLESLSASSEVQFHRRCLLFCSVFPLFDSLFFVHPCNKSRQWMRFKDFVTLVVVVAVVLVAVVVALSSACCSSTVCS